MLYNGQELYLRKNVDGLWYVVFNHEVYGVLKYSSLGFKHKAKANSLLADVQRSVA